MATNDDKPSLLSKMAKFVRNPTKDWNVLDHPQSEQESAYDKQALKAMIQRKRQNDFVRKREFDRLRKLRNNDPGALNVAARPSYFQSSMPTDPDGRAVTLKKIDEIEAQMSRQWWKGKQDAADDSLAEATPTPKPLPPTKRPKQAPLAPHAVPDTQQSTSSDVAGATDFSPTVVGSGMASLTGPAPSPLVPQGTAKALPMLGALADSYDGADVSFSTSKLFAIEAEEMATDPELEEAAIRFANGDDADAELGLLTALRTDAIGADVAVSWAAALLDLYRATNNRAGFDQALAEFSFWFDSAVPQWFSIPGLPVPGASPATIAASLRREAMEAHAASAIWCSPTALNVAAMEQLREAMGSQPQPWHLDWSRLDWIDTEAIPLLAGLFASLCNEPVSLRFSGCDTLVNVLRVMMPSGERGISPAWWEMRLNALRSMHMQDDFELVALDYCVTFEVSPPAWEESRCQFERLDATEPTTSVPGHPQAWSTSLAQASTLLQGLDESDSGFFLRGQILGDAMPALAAIEHANAGGARISICCKGLVRVDFSAAGSILNWVAMRQAEGSQVQFRDVHRLVATFFNVIGINEHARVIPRHI